MRPTAKSLAKCIKPPNTTTNSSTNRLYFNVFKVKSVTLHYYMPWAPFYGRRLTCNFFAQYANASSCYG